MLRSRDDSIAGGAATEGGAVSLFLEVCGHNAKPLYIGGESVQERN